MSDVSKINELITEARWRAAELAVKPDTGYGWATEEELMSMLANDLEAAEARVRELEAATRVPVQGEGYTVEVDGQHFTQAQWEAVQRYYEGSQAVKGEPNNDREAVKVLNQALTNDGPPAVRERALQVAAILARRALLSRATVPDAATDLDEQLEFTTDVLIEKITRQRDAATEAIERVKRLLAPMRNRLSEYGEVPLRFAVRKTLELLAALDWAPEPEPIQTLFYAPNVRNGVHTGRPDGFTEKEWHQSAMADTGFSHNLPGRLYVVQCEWCPKAFAALSKADAMEMFRQHEDEMSRLIPVESEEK